MQIKRVAAIAAVACLALGGLAACGDDDSGSGGPGVTGGLTGGGGLNAGKNNGVEKLTAKQIRDKAQSALSAATSVQVEIKSNDANGQLTLDHAGDCKGYISPKSGTRADVVKTGGASYLKGNDAFWESFAPEHANDVKSVVGDRYVKSTGKDSAFDLGDDFCDISEALTPSSDSDNSDDNLTKKGISTVNGVRCVEVTAKDSDGTENIFVATNGKPYPISMTGTSEHQPLKIDLGNYDKQVSIQAPPDDQVIDASQLPDSSDS